MYTLTCESTVDFTKEYIQKRNIPVIEYSYLIDDKEYFDDAEDKTEFYNALRNGKTSQTSQICVERYKDFFREYLKDGDLLHVAFDSQLSKSVENAYAAARELKEEFPDRKIYVVDSTCGGSGYGIFADTLCDLRDSGHSIDYLYDWATAYRKRVHHHFFATTLKFFRKSGRVSGATALIGDLLKICPLMKLVNDGKIISYDKAITAKKAIEKMAKDVDDNILCKNDYGDRLWIEHSDCLPYAEALRQILAEKYPKADIKMWEIGPVLGSHCGPGTVAVYFWGEERK